MLFSNAFYAEGSGPFFHGSTLQEVHTCSTVHLTTNFEKLCNTTACDYWKPVSHPHGYTVVHGEYNLPVKFTSHLDIQ